MPPRRRILLLVALFFFVGVFALRDRGISRGQAIETARQQMIVRFGSDEGLRFEALREPEGWGVEVLPGPDQPHRHLGLDWPLWFLISPRGTIITFL